MKLSHRWLLLVGGLFFVGGLPVSGQTPVTGNPTVNQTILPPPNPIPQVSITAKVPTAYAASGIPGQFTIQKLNGALQDITVNYEVSGKAVAGQDYKALKGTKVVPATKNKVSININPLAVAAEAGTVKGVRVTLLPGEGYTVASAAKATVKIVQ